MFKLEPVALGRAGASVQYHRRVFFEGGLAFEHQGIQHYNEEPFFHRGYKSLKRQKVDDEDKRKICAEFGVKLIEVPYLVALDDLQLFIIKECRSHSIRIPKNAEEMKIDLAGAYSPSYFNSIAAIAIDRGGKCISSEYIGSDVPLKFECERKHIFMKAPAKIKSGEWCSVCSGLRKKNIEEMKEYAAGLNGECLSDVYVNSKSNLDWRCQRGHRFSKSWNKVQTRGFCSKCLKEEKLLEQT